MGKPEWIRAIARSFCDLKGSEKRANDEDSPGGRQQVLRNATERALIRAGYSVVTAPMASTS
jgi:hypothetical protein